MYGGAAGYIGPSSAADTVEVVWDCPRRGKRISRCLRKFPVQLSSMKDAAASEVRSGPGGVTIDYPKHFREPPF